MTRLKNLLSTLPLLEIPTHGVTLGTFALFPNLAPELRDMIWHCASNESRAINIFRHEGTHKPSPSWQVEGQTRHPGIVQACRESRTVALKHYRKYEKISNRSSIRKQGHVIFVNFTVDRFLLAVPETTTLRVALSYADIDGFNFAPPAIHKIQHLEIKFLGNGTSNISIWHLLFTRYMLLLHNVASIASIRVTFIDSLRLAPICSPWETKRRLKTNDRYEKYVSNGLQAGRSLPALEFHWKTTDDCGSWPCAAS